MSGREPPQPPGAEDAFFRGEGPEPVQLPVKPKKKRESPLLARSPAFAVLALGACIFLLWDMWPDVQYFLSPTTPIDLGTPAAYHLDRAVPNRLVRISGAPLATVNAVETKTGEPRRVLGLFGANLAVDQPGRATGTAVFEGRLLPREKGLDYAEFVAALKDRGWTAGDNWWVLRDGERPRVAWGKPVLSLLIMLVALVNVRALLKALTS